LKGDEMRERGIHLVSLGAEIGVEVHLNQNPSFFSNHPVEGRAENWAIFVYGYKNKSEICYLVGLHELGHVVNEHTIGQERELWYDDHILEGEAEAWNWALDNTREKFSAYALNWILDYPIKTYLRNSPHENGYPGPSYHKLVERIRLAPFFN